MATSKDNFSVLSFIYLYSITHFSGILGDNSEYCIFDPPRYFSAHKMKLTLKLTLETQEIVMDEVQ